MRMFGATPKRLRTKAQRLAVLVSVALIVCFAVSSAIQTAKKEQPWIDKDWTEWTKQDCIQVLDWSPWVKVDRQDMGSYLPAYLIRDVKLLSALPVRQALLRQQQVENRYDKMKPQQRQAFDQQHAGDLAGREDGNMLVGITYSSVNGASASDSSSGYVDKHADPSRQTALKLSNGSLILPIQTTVLKTGDFLNECQYVFPRIAEGKPVIAPTDSTFVIMFGAPLVIDKKTKQVVPQPFQSAALGSSFKISEMTYKGKLEY
jgi:hypothetical protein